VKKRKRNIIPIIARDRLDYYRDSEERCNFMDFSTDTKKGYTDG